MNFLKQNEIVLNQVEYNLLNREIEKELMEFCRKNKITIMAYSPLAQGNLLKDFRFKKLEEIGKKYGKSGVQIALNWIISKENVVTIVKSENFNHLKENCEAANFELSKKDIERIEEIFD